MDKGTDLMYMQQGVPQMVYTVEKDLKTVKHLKDIRTGEQKKVSTKEFQEWYTQYNEQEWEVFKYTGLLKGPQVDSIIKTIKNGDSVIITYFNGSRRIAFDGKVVAPKFQNVLVAEFYADPGYVCLKSTQFYKGIEIIRKRGNC